MNVSDLLPDKPQKTKEFFLPILPKAQRRSRSRAIKTKSGNWTAMNYKDKEQETQEENLRSLLYEHKPETPWTGPIWLNVIITLPIPKSKPKKWRLLAAYRQIYHTTKPDIDNLLKHLKDCMKGIFYNDDRQIVMVQAKKVYGDLPGWDIFLGEF